MKLLAALVSLRSCKFPFCMPLVCMQRLHPTRKWEGWCHVGFKQRAQLRARGSQGRHRPEMIPNAGWEQRRTCACFPCTEKNEASKQSYSTSLPKRAGVLWRPAGHRRSFCCDHVHAVQEVAPELRGVLRLREPAVQAPPC